MKSPLAGLVSDHFGVDKRPPVDTAPFEHLFHKEQLPVLSNQQDVYNILREMPLILENTGFLDGIDTNAIQAMSASGMIVKVRADDVIVEAGKIEKKMTIILEGDCELYSGNKSISHLGPRKRGFKLATRTLCQPLTVNPTPLDHYRTGICNNPSERQCEATNPGSV
jgi:hypothetical protein